MRQRRKNYCKTLVVTNNVYITLEILHGYILLLHSPIPAANVLPQDAIFNLFFFFFSLPSNTYYDVLLVEMVKLYKS